MNSCSCHSLKEELKRKAANASLRNDHSNALRSSSIGINSSYGSTTWADCSHQLLYTASIVRTSAKLKRLRGSKQKYLVERRTAWVFCEQFVALAHQ